jgi:chromosome segregation ATPase
LESQVEDEQRQRDEAREAVNLAERRCNILASELDEMRVSLEQADRSRKAAEIDLHDAADRISELGSSNANLTAIKRKLESDMAVLQSDMDEAIHELKNSEERLKKASSDAARLAEELRHEQDHSLNIEKLRKALEQHVKDLQVRLDEAESNALKGGKRIIQKLEQKIHELETELDIEQRHHQETIKEVRKNDRRLKELAFSSEEDRKSHARLQDLIEKLQNKLKVYKRQAEEAEEIAAVNLAKFRKVQHELEDAEERTSQAENQLNKQRAKNRSTVSLSRVEDHSSSQCSTTVITRAQSVRAASVRRLL